MKIRFNLSYCLIVIYFLIIGCHSDDIRELSIPILQTTKITDITETTASSGGLVLSDGGTSMGYQIESFHNTLYQNHRESRIQFIQ